MSTCTILNLNKEPSKLYDKLVEVFGNEDLALIEYRKVMGPTFRDQFGDWKHNYMNPTSENLSDVGLMDGSEPKVKHDVINDLWFYVDRNGDKMFVDKMKLSEFETFEIDDVVGHLFSRFAKEHEQFNLGEWSGTTSESGLVLDSIDRSIAALRDDIVFSGKHTAEQKQDLLEKVDRVENDRLAFRSELIVAITGLGVKVRERVFDANGELESEVSEEDKGGGVNIKDSFETSTKQSATVKTKIWLSQIERRVQKDGLSNPIKDGFLQTESFADFDDVWNTLNRILVDTVGYGEGQATADVFDLMIDKLKGFANTKPFLDHVIERLESARKTGDTQMLNEFVQAFSKTTLNYFVTQVNSGEYSVLNATASGSRRQQITGDWMNNFEATWMGENGVITEDDQQEIKELNLELRDLKKQWGVLAKAAGTNVEAAGYKETMASPEAFEILNNLLSLLDDLGAPGLQLEDISMLVAMNGGVKEHTRAIARIFNATDYAIGEVLKGINDKNQFLDKEGQVPNIFKREKYLLAFADAVGFRETNRNETSVLLSQGKTGYAISNPTYITNRVNRWKQESKLASSHYDQHSTEMTTELGNLGNNPDLKNSQWLNHLLAKGEGLSTKGRVKESAKRISELTVGLDSSFTTQGRNDSVTNTDITTNDNINANLAQILNSVLGDNRKSMFPTIIAADKSRRVLFEGFETMEFGFKIGVDGALVVPDAAVDVASGYFKDEYNRMRRVMRENETLDATKQIVHFHGKDGNGTKSQIFPELSRENTDPAFQEFRDAFYKVDTFSDPTHEGLSTSQEDMLKSHIRKSISDRVKEHDNTLSNLDGKSTQLMQHYSGNPAGLAGDYFMNGLISSVEYTKLFSGDPAYYKNTADLIKRIPATYTDGLQLRLDSSDSLIFNTATIEGVEVASKYIQKIKESVKDKSIAKAYENVNTTDAQAWITPRRWKFLKEKLGQWSDAHTAVYEKMQKGETLGTKEAKLAAQPLKGVYFEINDGRPVYLKYSQAVLIPSLVKGTPMEALYDKMTKDANGNPIPDSEAQNEIHEVITIDGVKVGAMAPTRINEDGTTEMLTGADLVLNPTKLNNRGWKLQQDLPIKRMHETNVGSQIQKNIFEGLDVDGSYDYEGGMDGREIAQSMHNTISALSDMGKDRVKDKFGIDENNVMTDTSKLYNALIEEFKDRGGNDNIVLALQKGFPFDAIPQIKGKVESILMSMISREILKVSTNGGSFIQVSPFGLEKIGKDSGIIVASKKYNGEGLLPPRIDKKTGKVLPGQAMIPHSAAVELLKKQGIDLAGKKMKDVIHLLDPSALEMITYRIPNQGMSSNDYLEIVAILPDGVGDSIVVYDGLPAKTGSDFDIDKLFAMQNHLVYDPEIGRLEKLAEHNVHLAVKTPGRFKKGVYQEPVMHTQTEIDKMLLENDLVAQYKAVLNSPATYDNMMRSIDGAQLQDDISGKKDDNGVRQEGLFPEGTYKNMDLFSPLTQLETKRAYLSGKFGVAQTANQLVDHSMNQLLDVRMHTWLGIGNSREETINGKKRRISFFDTETQDGHSIADNLSAFLNAYVDIAKDPYISRANHNAITANTTFMLLRAGAPLKWVNRFIGQPILKELVELQMEQQSITAKSIELKGEKASPIDVVMQKYGVAALEQNPSGNTVAQLGEARLEKIIRDPSTATPEDLRQILSAWTFLQEKGKNFGEAVIAAKADTNGPGASNVERLVNKNKIEKVLSEGVILGYGEKFEDTMLGTYTENSINWVGEVMASTNLFWSGNREMRGMYDAISMETGNGPSLVNLDLAKSIESNMYTYLMAGTSVFEGNTNPDAWAYLTRELPKEINNRKTDAGKTTGNAFLDALNIETVKGEVFLGLDSKDKPTKWQNDMYRGWSALYNSYLTNEDGSISEETHPDKLLAVNLARYSFANSGFQNNLAQFFTSLPHQILSDFRVTGEVRDIFNQMADNQGDQNFVDQFQRHNSADSNVVKSLKENQVTGNQLVFAYKPAKFKSKELGSVRKIGKKEVRVFPKFVTRKVSPIDAQGNPLMGPKVDQLYEMFGTIKSEDAEGDSVQVPVYSLTFKMGAKVGKFKRFEYIRGEEALQSNEWVNNVSEEKKVRVDNYKRAAKVKYKKTFKELDGSEFSEQKLAAEAQQVLTDMQVLKESLDEVMKLKDINCK
jgi:hypothetical protein